MVYIKGTKIYKLFQQIIADDNLYHLYLRNDGVFENINLFMCINQTNNNPSLDDYIDEYLNIYSDHIDIENDFGESLLISATLNSNTLSTKNTVKMLLKHTKNINFQDKYGYTALMYAVQNCVDEVVEILLNHNADTNIQNNLGETALMFAVQSSDKITNLLLKNGAKINMQDENGKTALFFISPRSTNTFKILLEYGADINHKDNGRTTVLMDIVYNINNFDIKNLIQILINYGADVNIQDVNGCSALLMAFYQFNPPYSAGIIKLLLDNGAKVNMQNLCGFTALGYAINITNIFYRNYVAKLLIEYNANIYACDMWDKNIITKAFINIKSDRGIIDILLPKRKNIFEKSVINKRELIKRSDYWKANLCDFKILYKKVNAYYEIILFM